MDSEKKQILRLKEARYLHFNPLDLKDLEKIWVNYNDLTTTSLGIIGEKGKPSPNGLNSG